MSTRSRLEAELATRRYTRRHAREIVTGILGNNAGVVVAAASTRWYNLRLHGDPNQVVRAWNAGFVPPVNNLPVDVEIIKANGLTDYQIIGVSINKGVSADVYAGATGMHALQHQRRDFNEGGFDPLDIYARAMIPLRARAQVVPNMTLYVEPGFYSMNGVISYWAGGNSGAFAAMGGGLRIDLLYLNAAGALAIVAGTIAPLGNPSYPTTPTTGAIPIAFVHLIATTTAITEYLIEDARILFGSSGAASTNALLDGLTHTDTLAGTVVDGDLIIGNITPKWSRLAIAIPAANVRNVLGVDNGELRPSWKTALDATAPSTQAFGDAASAGTSLVFSHRDHKHAMPATPVTSLAKSGSAALTGAVTLSQGANITLTQSGQDISIAGAAGSALTVKEEDGAPSVANVTEIRVTNGTLTDNTGGSVSLDFGSAATDGAAIHDNVAGEIAAITEKVTPVDADMIIIEDSADSNNKKMVQIGNLPGGAGGAPTTSEYVTTASDAGLSAEVAIPGLAGSPDIAGAGGAGVSYEFDSASDPFTWTATSPNTIDSDTTIKSHYYIKSVDNTERFGLVAWAPAGAAAFDARMKISVGINQASGAAGCGMVITDNANANRAYMDGQWGSTFTWKQAAYTFASSTYTQRGSTANINKNTWYQRITRDGSNNVSFYFSHDGILWQLIATQAFTFTVAKIGIRIAGTSITADYTLAIDWLRANV